MRLLDRYLLRELLVPLGYCLVGFFIFFIAFDLFADLSDFQKRHLLVIDVVEYYFYKTPELFGVTLPITLLLALLYSLSNHARHQEITAMRGAGISLFRFALPYFSVGFLLSVILFVLNEWWIPQSVERTEQIMDRYQTNQTVANQQEWELNCVFENRRDQRRWVIEAFNERATRLQGAHIQWLQRNGVRHELYAQNGLWQNGHWVFTNIQESIYPPSRGMFPVFSNYSFRVMHELTETPEEIGIHVKLSKIDSFREARKAQLSIREILIYRRLYPDDIQKNTLLHGRLAAPWTCMVVVLIALPFGAAPGRRNVFVGVASSIVICFLYFILQQLSLALGYGGRIPGWLAGWLPNLTFAAAGIIMTWRIR